MLYQLSDELKSVSLNEISDNYIYSGELSVDDIKSCYNSLLIDKGVIDYFGIANFDCKAFEGSYLINLDSLIIISKSSFVILSKASSSLRDCLLKSLKRCACDEISIEKLIHCFFEEYINEFDTENIKSSIEKIELKVIESRYMLSDSNELFEIKRAIRGKRLFINKILYVINTLLENECNIFDDEINCLYSILNKINIKANELDFCWNNILQLINDIQVKADFKLNKTMGKFTKITLLFYPLSVLVGWYGMNFDMPEFRFRYSYYIIIILAGVFVFWVLYKIKKEEYE